MILIIKVNEDNYKTKLQRQYKPVSILADVNSARHTSRLAAASQVHSVTEKAVARHAMTNHSCHHLTSMDTDCDTLRILVWSVSSMYLIVIFCTYIYRSESG